MHFCGAAEEEPRTGWRCLREKDNAEAQRTQGIRRESRKAKSGASREKEVAQPTPQEQAQRKKEALAERVEKLSRVRILEAIRKKLPDALSRPDLEMVALDYFRRLGHDNHRRLSKLYAWDEKKSKASRGEQIADYEKIAADAVQAMKPAGLNRFLVLCALVSDLYCPGYNPRQPLEKNSNLARTATRHKIDAARVGATVRGELTKQVEAKPKPKSHKTCHNSPSARHEPSKAKPTK